jgi:hypothetical protein
VWNSTQGTTIETDVASGVTRLIIDTSILPNPATVVVTAENKLGTDQSFALLQVNEPTTRVGESPSRRVLEEKMHESGQETTSLSEASELQRRSTDERLEEHAQSQTQGSIEMGQIQTKTVTTEKFEEKLVIKQHLTDQRVERGQRSQFKTVIEHADNIKWIINGQPVDSNTPGIKVSTNASSEHELIVESSQNSSTIKCEARNASDQVETSAKLEVIPPAPKFGSELPSKTQVREGEQIKVEVVAEDAKNFDWKLDEKSLQVCLYLLLLNIKITRFLKNY